MAEEASSMRSSQGSSSRRAPKNPQQQLSQIEKSVTHLLVATKQLLETLTLWSRGTATESEVSDVYVRLGYEFNIASRAFNAIGVDTNDLGNVPELLRGILEETLSQEASQSSLDNFLPRIRDIIINLLHGLKKKQQRLRQRTGRDGSLNGGGSPRQGSVGSSGDMEEGQQHPRSASQRLPSRGDSPSFGGPDLPPRSSSVAGGKASPSKYDALPSNPKANRSTTASQLSTDSSMSSTTAQQMPVTAPYPSDDAMPKPPEQSQQQKQQQQQQPNYPVDFPPPPPPPKQEDALAALQRGGELERRASRRFSAYQIQKHLGTNGIPLPPVQNSPIPNRGRDVRESMNAVRTRASMMHNRQRSNQQLAQQRPAVETKFSFDQPNDRRISEESSNSRAPSILPPQESGLEDSPIQKTPDDKIGTPKLPEGDQVSLGATLNGPLSEPAELGPGSPVKEEAARPAASRNSSSRAKTPSPQPTHFIPEQSPQQGKELTLFLQYKSKIKKYVFADGSELSSARLQLAFIEKFAWDTHRYGDLPEIHIQDPVSGVRYELEDIHDIKDRSVLVLNVEQLDEVKSHIDDKFGGLSKLVESIKTVVDDQQATIQRVAERQQQTTKEIAGMSAAPLSSARNSALFLSRSTPTGAPTEGNVTSATQLSEVQALRRDLAVVRQTYSSFVSDIQASMSTIRTKAGAVKSTAIKAALPSLDGDSGRAYINTGKKALQDDSEKIVNRVDDLQDLVEDLRKDVVLRGVRPLPRQLETTAKDLSTATAELKKLQDLLAKEKPLWTKIWEQELQTVCEERDMLTMQEELAADLQDDLEKAAQTLELVEQATKQQNLESEKESGKGMRSVSGRNMLNAVALDKVVDPRQARDGVLGEVKALQPNHEGRLEAIERAEKARQRDLATRNDDEFKRELGNFVEEGKLKKSGGIEEAERLRKAKDERARKENFEREAARQRAKAEKQAREAEAAAAAAAAAATNGDDAEGRNGEAEAAPENQEEAKGDEDLPQSQFTIRPWVKPGGVPLSMQMRFAAATGLDLPVSVRMPSSTATISTISASRGSTTIRVVGDSEQGIDETIESTASALLNNVPGALIDTTPTPSPAQTPNPSFSRGNSTLKSPSSSFSLSHHTLKPSLSFRSREKPTLDTAPPSPSPSPHRPRGKTFPHANSSRLTQSKSRKTLDTGAATRSDSSTDGLSEGREGGEGDADSVVSFTPSSGSRKNIATWFSGFLGRS
ncbi:aip3-domain-containing protein [Stemphylium lycopersici]|uniref:Aip3-domain-containing protein n=1 Tax=Stemphylium lycopersici TaxID=183478 RepID=A0A364MW79_STELY|nr:aip3-domain-containing protein [Stemphylium lycopersici]